MKKIVKVLFVIILVVLLALVVTPLLFKQQILTKAKEIANSSVNAKIDFRDLKLSFFKNFPRLTTSLYDVSVAGIDVFEGDTLLAFDEFSATVNVMSLIKGDAISVRSILLDHPRISGIVLEDGTANWDIAKEGEEPEEETDTAASGQMDLKVELKEFEIRNAGIAYNDLQSALSASLEGFNLLLSGDLSEDFSSLVIESKTEKVNVSSGGIRYIKDAVLNILINVDADLANSVYTLTENSFAINDLVLELEGLVEVPEDDDLFVDMRFNSPGTSFKSLLSMVPAVYMKDFEDIRTSGEISLSGNIKGKLTDEHSPSANLKLRVKDARFNYPDLPKSAENINIDVDVAFDGIQNDNSRVDVNRFHVELGGNPVDLVMHVITPVSDPAVNGQLRAVIDFSSLKDVVPMDDMDIQGTLNASLDMMGKMSSIEKEEYEDFQAEGSLDLRDFVLESADIPERVVITRTLMNFSPKYVDLAQFDAMIGSSDLHMNGKLENFIPFLFDEGTVFGSLDLSSSLLDLNEFLTEEPEETVEETEDTVAMSVVEIPGNIDFVLSSNLKKVKYDKLDMENLKGRIIVRDQRLILENLNFDVLQGKIGMSGEYNTQDITSPMVDFTLDIRDIDIPSAFDAFVTVQKLAPIAERTQGKVSTKLDFTSLLDQEMMPVMNSIVGKGNLESDKIEINNSATFEKIGAVLKTDRFKVITMRDLDIQYAIRDGRVYIEPYQTMIGKNELIMKGDQGLDQTLNYEVKMKIPRSELGSTAESAISSLAAAAAAQGIKLDPGETVDVKFLVGGTFSDPKVRPVFEDFAGDMTRQLKEQVKEEVKQVVEEKVAEVKQEAMEEVNREAERILAEAEVQAEMVRQEARNGGKELIKASEDEGKRMISQAGSNPLKKASAEQYAKQLKTEAEKKATQLEKEADKQAEAILKKARDEADRLK